MKTAIIGSRKSNIKIDGHLPKGISLIISGGARGIDTLAERYADKNGIPKLIFLPDYEKYGSKVAPLQRNKLIVENADIVIAFWNGVSKGTKFTIDYAKKLGKKVKLVYADALNDILPANYGKDCICNGEHHNLYGDLVACFCDTCDYAPCCDDINYPETCENCPHDCNRKEYLSELIDSNDE